MRRENAKYAARERRTLEGDFLQELQQMLPFSGPPPSSQQTSLDKTSVIRLSLAGLKCAKLVSDGETSSIVLSVPQTHKILSPRTPDSRGDWRDAARPEYFLLS